MVLEADVYRFMGVSTYGKCSDSMHTRALRGEIKGCAGVRSGRGNFCGVEKGFKIERRDF